MNALQWYDKLFFFGLALTGTGLFTCIFAFSAMVKATRL